MYEYLYFLNTNAKKSFEILNQNFDIMIHLTTHGLEVYRHLGDLNSQWHNKKFKKVPVGGSATWGKCQLGEAPVGGQVPVGGQKFNPWMDDFLPIP